jgi:hypothetical protein
MLHHGNDTKQSHRSQNQPPITDSGHAPSVLCDIDFEASKFTPRLYWFEL